MTRRTARFLIFALLGFSTVSAAVATLANLGTTKAADAEAMSIRDGSAAAGVHRRHLLGGPRAGK